MYRGRIAAVSLLSVFLSLIFFTAAYAQTSKPSPTDEADKMCPQSNDYYIYNPSKPHNQEYTENNVKHFNVYGKPCKDLENKEVAASGICTKSHFCEADQKTGCGGKECKLPDGKTIEDQIPKPDTTQPTPEEITRQVEEANRQDSINNAFQADKSAAEKWNDFLSTSGGYDFNTNF
ncbi:MAG: hypothetical protein WC050_04385, partial [Candidatus Paceibacterota bacterium]